MSGGEGDNEWLSPDVAGDDGDRARRDELLDEVMHQRERVVVREMQLADLRARVDAFAARYAVSVGRELANLREIELEVALRAADRAPSDHHLREAAERLREDAVEARRIVREAQARPAVSYDDDVRRLYRATCRLLHPDLAIDESDIPQREAMMREVTEAWRMGDFDRLQAIHDSWRDLREQVDAEAGQLEAILQRLIARVARLEQAIDELRSDVMHALMVQCERAQEDGERDLLESMAEQVSAQVADARRRLEELQ